MFKLPEKRTSAVTEDPEKLLIISVGKMGKTSIIAQLPKCLIFDLEGGSNFVEEGNIINIPAETKKYNENKKEDEKEMTELDILSEYIKLLDKENPYEYIAIDTVTKLEEMVMPLACKLYKSTAMGSKFSGNDVLALPNGAGYLYIRNAFNRVWKKIASLTPKTILIGHIKDKSVNKLGKEVMIRDIDLTGKLGRIVCQDMDAIGILYADGNTRKLSFKKESVDFDSIFESRAAHLSNKEIVISEMSDEGILKTHWNKVFKNV